MQRSGQHDDRPDRNLETERLRLYPFQSTDLTLLHQTFTNSFVRRFLWDDKIITLEQSKNVLLTNDKTFAEHGWGLWRVILKRDNTYAGFAGLWTFFDENRPQLLYGLLPDKVKWGYATEASKAIVNYAFDLLKFDYLDASCDTPNRDSIGVCERLGMKHIKDEWVNGKMTSFYRVDRRSRNKTVGF